MPWRTCRPMDERLRFIARLLEGEKMSPLCREFGISRVTGYKIPRYIWILDRLLPRNASGKALKRQLQEEFDPELAS